MSAVVRSKKSGFTLVEILIVVVILGILAAIVIPQFTSASTDARQNSLTSQVQTLRSQIELYKLQHTTDASELFKTATSDATTWQELVSATGKATAVIPPGTETTCGPYLQTVPVNNVTSKSGVFVGSVDETTTAIDTTKYGFAYNRSTGKFFGVKADGTIWKGN